MIEPSNGMRLVRMELKYCERCGGLLLRRAGEAAVYCGPCDRKMSEMATSQTSQRNSAQNSELYGHPGPVNTTLEASAVPAIPPQTAVLLAVASEQRRWA